MGKIISYLKGLFLEVDVQDEECTLGQLAKTSGMSEEEMNILNDSFRVAELSSPDASKIAKADKKKNVIAPSQEKIKFEKVEEKESIEKTKKSGPYLDK